jgi:large subunit ribosomal protein L3
MLGLIGRKVGMTQVFDAEGILTPVTVINIEDNVVVAKREVERNGYAALVIGSIDMKKNRVRKPYGGQFKNDIAPTKVLVELRDFEKECEVGERLGADLFEGFEYVDVVGVSKGKGCQGVMKRYGFGGGPGSHGSKFHRGNGSTGQSAYPSRVVRGTHMPGRMGGEKTTVQNLKVVRVDVENKILLVKGAVPGAAMTALIVKKARKK